MTTSNTTARGGGKLQGAGGTHTKTIGVLIENEQLEVEAKAKELRGQASEARAKNGELLKGTMDRLADGVTGEVGALIGNEQMDLEGKGRKLKGQLRPKTGA